MDTRNPLFEKSFPDWKKNLWGALRAFVAGFISSLAIQLLSINGDSITDANWWIKIVLYGSLVGGIVGLGKFLRDLYPESKVLARLPI